MPTLVGYILIQTESQSVQEVNSYDILFAGMSNVWKRYLFANPVTYLRIYIYIQYILYIPVYIIEQWKAHPVEASCGSV